jgi:hypothetical protein
LYLHYCGKGPVPNNIENFANSVASTYKRANVHD